MSEIIAPDLFNLPSRTIVEFNNGVYYLVINRKSRIIMKDADNICRKINAIKEYYPHSEVKLKTNAPVCSKTKAFLKAEGIDIQFL